MKCMKNTLPIELHKIIGLNYKFLADRKFDVGDLQRICQRDCSLFPIHV